MKRYDAVICDMFDTLVDFRWDRLPLVKFDGQEVRSSSPLVYEAMRSVCPGVSLSEFCRAFIECSRETETVRNATRQEVTARERFQMLRRRLGIPDGPVADLFLQVAVVEQMRQLRRAMDFPDDNREALDALRSRYRLAVLSNFDHTPAVEAALEDFGIRDHFEVVVVSADTGWRKPHPEIYHEVLRRMRLQAQQAVFVGDTPDADVCGPQRVGMDTIWIDRGTAGIPPDSPGPTWTVSRFAEVPRLL